MKKVKEFFKIEVVLSIIIPLIISAFSYTAAQAKYTERLGQAEKTLVSVQQVEKETSDKVQNHMLESQRESGQLLLQIKVLDSKVDSIKEDLQYIKNKVH